MSAADSLALDFSNMWGDDPIMKALIDGNASWGDILCSPEEEARCRANRAVRDAADSASISSDEPDITIISKRRYAELKAFAPQAKHQKHTLTGAPEPVAVEVPPFTPGIKTVITRNLPRDVRVEQLRSVFEKYGPIKDIYIPKNMDRSSQYFGTIKGFALIKYLKSDDSARAYQSEYGRLVLGRNNITVEFAKEDR